MFALCRWPFPSERLCEPGEKDDGSTAGVIIVVDDILFIVEGGLARGTGFTDTEEATWQKVNCLFFQESSSLFTFEDAFFALRSALFKASIACAQVLSVCSTASCLSSAIRCSMILGSLALIIGQRDRS